MLHAWARRAILSFILAPLVLAGTAEAAFAAPEPSEPSEPSDIHEPIKPLKDRPPSVGPRVEWNKAWPRFRWWEYVATPLVLAGGLSMRFFLDPPDNKWQKPPSFDESVQRAMGIQGDTVARDFWQTFSDYSFRGAMVYPVIDVGVAALIHQSPDVAWQMLMVDLEGFAVTGLGIFALQALVAREPPYGRYCTGPSADADCNEPDRWRSFPSGHVAIGVAGAALTCLHHARMPLYGGKVADSAACWASVVLASGNLVGRVAANRHYMTDVMAGTVIGVLGGFVVPAALHYGFHNEARWGPSPLGAPSNKKKRRTADGVRMMIAPYGGVSGDERAMGAQVIGVF
jgi:membrane-associated phospholipid phosphatase